MLGDFRYTGVHFSDNFDFKELFYAIKTGWNVMIDS